MNFKIMKLLLSSILIVMSSCGMFTGSSRKIKKDQSYVIHFNQSGWIKIDPQGSDHAFSNQKGDFLFSNSFCQEFQDSSLDKLALKSLHSLDNFKIIKAQNEKYKERESYIMSGKGMIDGVSTEIIIRNYRRDHCYYDFFLIAPTITNELSQTFNQFVDSIKFK